ncbi:hypothetical protein AAVH_13539 [Aphelenchoides avenae]|nr:hypothetical protein AAVH_13539 [Aphelenchus avenae]
MNQAQESVRNRKEQLSQIAASYLWIAVYWWRDLNVQLYTITDIKSTSGYATRFEDNEPVYTVDQPNADYGSHAYAPGTVEGYCAETDLYAVKVGRHLLHLPAQDLRKRMLDPVYGKGPTAFRPSHMPERIHQRLRKADEEMQRRGTSMEELLDHDMWIEEEREKLKAKVAPSPTAPAATATAPIKKIVFDGTTGPSLLAANIEALGQLIRAGKGDTTDDEATSDDKPKLHLTLSAAAPKPEAQPTPRMRTPSPPVNRPPAAPQDALRYKLSYDEFKALQPGCKLHALSNERPNCTLDYRDVEFKGPANYTLTDLGELKPMPRYFEDTKVYVLVSKKDVLSNLHEYGTIGCYLPGTLKSPRHMGSSFMCKVEFGHELGREPSVVPRLNVIDRAHFQIRPFHAVVVEEGRVQIAACFCYHPKVGLHAVQTVIPKSEAIRSKAKKRIQAQ